MVIFPLSVEDLIIRPTRAVELIGRPPHPPRPAFVPGRAPSTIATEPRLRGKQDAVSTKARTSGPSEGCGRYSPGSNRCVSILARSEHGCWARRDRERGRLRQADCWFLTSNTVSCGGRLETSVDSGLHPRHQGPVAEGLPAALRFVDGHDHPAVGGRTRCMKHL